MMLNGVKVSPRHGQLAVCISEGKSEKAIAAELGLTPGTVKMYTSLLYRRVGLAVSVAGGGGEHRVKLARMVWEAQNPVTALQGVVEREREAFVKGATA